MTVIIGSIQRRRATAAAWTAANPILLDGQWGYETNTWTTVNSVVHYKMKVGDGVTSWNALPYSLIGQPTFTKSDVGLGNVDNTSDVNKPVSTAQAAADAAILVSANSYSDGLVIGLWDDRGVFDASGGAYPTAANGGSGIAGAILKGDIWTISVAGTLPIGQVVEIGDIVRALIDTPGNTQANWGITQNNIGYVAENSANKSTDGTFSANSDILYPSQKAAKTYSDSKVTQTITNGVTATAPSEDAVFDALALKLSTSSIGSTVQAWDADLDAIAALVGTNTIYYRSAANTWTDVTIGGNLSFAAGVLNINSSYVGQTSITTLGTITTGTWNGSVISPVYGGTGVANNVASTLTISGNFATTLTVTAATSVTLPTSGTLYGTAASSITSAQMLASMSDETGTGLLVFATSPTFTTDITTPKIYGGTAVGSNVIYQSTTGAGTTTGISHQFTGGTNGATVNSTLYNDGQFLIATTTRNPGSVGIFRVGQGTSTCDIGQTTAGSAAIWFGQSTPTTTNYAVSQSGTTFTVLNAPTQAGTILFTALGTGTAIAAFKGPQTSTVVVSYNFTPANEASLTASTEKVTFNVATSTVSHATGALATNRYAVINAPTYGFTAASTLSDAVTFEVTAAPIVGSNATFTRAWAARLLGNVAIGGSMYIGASAGTTAPTALLHLAAGNGNPGTAPSKYASGTILAAMEAGVHEYNGNHYLSNATTRFSLGGTLPFDNFADVSVGGAETDIYSATLLANTFNVNGDKVIAMYGGNFVTVGTELTQLKVYLAGTAIWDSTALAPATGTTSWRVAVELIRVSSTVVRYTVSLNTTGATGYVYCTSGELTGLTLSGTNIIKITGTSSGVGSGAGDIVGKMGYININPTS